MYRVSTAVLASCKKLQELCYGFLTIYTFFRFQYNSLIFVFPLGCIVAGIFIVATSYVSDRYLCVLFLVIGVGFSGMNATGYAVNHLDLAPRYAGVLMGLSNTFGSLPGFLSPMLTGYIAKSKVSGLEAGSLFLINNYIG